MFALGKPASLAISAWVLWWEMVVDAVGDRLCCRGVLVEVGHGLVHVVGLMTYLPQGIRAVGWDLRVGSWDF